MTLVPAPLLEVEMTPRTVAGRALLEDFEQYAMHDPTLDGSPRTYAFDEQTLRMWVAAIEAEAIAAARERIEALPGNYQHDAFVRRAAVLAALAAPSDAPEKP